MFLLVTSNLISIAQRDKKTVGKLKQSIKIKQNREESNLGN